MELEVTGRCAVIFQHSTASKSKRCASFEFETPSLLLRLSTAEGHEHHQAIFELMNFFHE